MSLDGTTWLPIGPSPIQQGANGVNGLVSSIAVNPSNANLIYLGTAGGGVWRTRDGGLNWTALFDRQLASGIGEPAAIAIDPKNTSTLYVGTGRRITFGSGNAGSFGPTDLSQGVYKSTDGGGSWIQLGSGFPAGNVGNAFSLFVGRPTINVILVDPTNSNTLYLGATNGVFRSIDGGQNWASAIGGDARSLVLDPSSPAGARILYAGISGRGVFASPNGGQTWRQILSGATPAVVAALGPAPGAGFNKVVVDIAPPAAAPHPLGVQFIYVSLEGISGAPDPVGLFQSTNQGTSWSKRTATLLPTNTQGGYSFHMAVDPASPGDGINDIICFGAVGLARSIDSGSNFTKLSLPHTDCHAWAYFPQPAPTPSIIYSGTDGGFAFSTNAGGAWTTRAAGTLQTALVYNVDIRPDPTGTVIVAALQDNGLVTTAGGIAAPGWNSPQGGDGYDVAYDATPGTVYGTTGAWAAPTTRVFVSGTDGTNFPSTTPNIPTFPDITPWGTTTDQTPPPLFPLTTDPSNPGTVYVSGNQNLWQTLTGGASWRILSPFPSTGNVEVARANGNNVIIAVGNQVSVTTNARAAIGVTFTNITRNLPPRIVVRAVFDPNDPTVIYAVIGGFAGAGGQQGHVFTTTIGGTAWTDISPAAPLDPADPQSLPQPLDIPFNAIALDGADTPTTIYAGTDLGVLRSVDAGQSWSVLDDIHFPRVPVTDLVLNPAARMLVAGTYGRGVFRFGKPITGVVAVSLEHNLAFDTICRGPQYLTLEVTNVGAADLTINSVQRLMGSTDFSIMPTPGTPLVVSPGDEIDFTVRFLPSVPGVFQQAVIRISSDDPTAPFVDLLTRGLLGTGAIVTAIPDSGNFGTVCIGAFTDEDLVIANNGPCPLTIFGLASNAAEFVPPGVAAYPIVIGSGGSIELPIRFQPFSFGPKAGTLTITSDDPASPRLVNVSGICGQPRLVTLMPDQGDFGHVCVGSFADEPLTLNNAGRCTLSVSAIASSSPDFVVPAVVAYPISIGAGDSVEIPIRFQPQSFGPKAGTITITSDDPSGPRIIDVAGNAPSGRLAVTGSTVFGGVKCCHRNQRVISICNVGDCALHVSRVAFKRKRRHFRLINNPFPAKLHPGSCLNVVIQYRATERVPKSCELVITSDDPQMPVKCLDVIAYTIWECCDDCHEKRDECCEKREKGCERKCRDDDDYEAEDDDERRNEYDEDDC